MSETKKKCKPKEKPKSKSKPKSNPKPKAKPKDPLSKQGKVIVQLEEHTPKKDENVYTNKLKLLVNKIKTQNEYTDSGIRFAWRN